MEHRICPLGFDGGALRVAVEERSATTALDELAVAYRSPVVPEQRSPADIDWLIDQLLVADDFALGTPPDEEAHGGDGDAFSLASQPPVIRYVNLLIREAQHRRASDIHLESGERTLSARLRIDGVLWPAALQPPDGLGSAIASRIKLLASIDISEKRKPQDGRIWIKVDRGGIDLRVSTVPTLYGESIVLRLLERSGHAYSLGDLGVGGRLEDTLRSLARSPHGMVLATGPTGSGKTTTLHAALGARDPSREKIVTVEDPIERSLKGVNQVPVHQQAGVSFGSALRAILRQDPDVILVGEMRDAETAEVAFQAALTGHMIFSTLHTGDAVGAVPRVLDLGIPPYILAATLNAVLAQRLVRRICDGCRAPYTPQAELIRFFEHATGPAPLPSNGSFLRGEGCDACAGSGFHGRVGLFELLVVTGEVRALIESGANVDALRGHIWGGVGGTLMSDGARKVASGHTTLEEVVRVVCT